MFNYSVFYNEEIKRSTVNKFDDIEPEFLKVVSKYKNKKDESEIVRKLREQISELIIENLNLKEELKAKNNIDINYRGKEI